mmetsp:Transcript_21248/g.65949  ORF Transcript_21248/g.65949 Transcript_21248/m.65949 type:complete len:97 (-) Transcript_21248:1001-1291(-)
MGFEQITGLGVQSRMCCPVREELANLKRVLFGCVEVLRRLSQLNFKVIDGVCYALPGSTGSQCAKARQQRANVGWPFWFAHPATGRTAPHHETEVL